MDIHCVFIMLLRYKKKKILFVEGGNHKIFIRVNVPGYQEDLAERQMNEFKKDYSLNGLKKIVFCK